jgi:hypothetical protein
MPTAITAAMQTELRSETPRASGLSASTDGSRFRSLQSRAVNTLLGCAPSTAMSGFWAARSGAVKMFGRSPDSASARLSTESAIHDEEGAEPRVAPVGSSNR